MNMSEEATTPVTVEETPSETPAAEETPASEEAPATADASDVSSISAV